MRWVKLWLCGKEGSKEAARARGNEEVMEVGRCWTWQGPVLYASPTDVYRERERERKREKVYTHTHTYTLALAVARVSHTHFIFFICPTHTHTCRMSSSPFLAHKSVYPCLQLKQLVILQSKAAPFTARSCCEWHDTRVDVLWKWYALINHVI